MEQSKFYQIKNITEHEYTLVGCDGSVITRPIQEVDKSASAFTITDAKDGDVLYSKEHNLLWLHKDSEQCHSCINLNYSNNISIGTDIVIPKDAYPATKEKREFLFTKLKEVGYKWDAEKRELKKIESQSSQWNISDFRTWQYIVCDVLTKHDGIGQYLDDGFCKKIAKYMQEEWSKKLCSAQYPVEWSEEDERIRTCLIEASEEELEKVKNDKYGHSEIISDLKGMYRERIDWLKSLEDRVQPQNKWKPTKEQIEALQAIGVAGCISYPNQGSELIKLYQDLKKLTEYKL